MSEEKQIVKSNYEKIRAIARSDSTLARFAEVLGPGAPGFISSVLLLVSENDKLAECTPGSIIGAAMRAATMQLSVDSALGQAYIIPYKDHGTPKARFQVGYKGLVQLAIRTGKYRFLNVFPVYEGQVVEEDQFRGIHTILGNRTSNKAIGFMMFFELVSGFQKTHYMSVEQIISHAQAYSKTYNQPDGFWQKHTVDMMKKTVLLAGLRRWGYFNPHDSMMIAETETIADDEIDVDYSEVENKTPQTEAQIMGQLGFES